MSEFDRQLHVSTIASQYWCAIKLLMKHNRPDLQVETEHMSRGTFFHHLFGFDREEPIRTEYRGWYITGTPDLVLEDTVVEFKTLHDKADFKFCMYPAIAQANIYATLRNKPHFVIIIATVKGSQMYKIWNSNSMDTRPEKSKKDIDSAIDILENLVEPIPPQQRKCYSCDARQHCKHFEEVRGRKYNQYIKE